MKQTPKLWAAALLGVVFTTGAVAGSMATSAWSERDRDEWRERNRRSFSEMLNEELSLGDAQTAGVARIIEDFRPRLCEIWSEMRPRYQSMRTEVNDQIRELLNPEQQEAFEVILNRSDSIYSARRNRRGGENGC